MEKSNGKAGFSEVIIMKIIDWYIIRKFLGSFFYTIILFAAISVVIDITEKMDDFIDSSASLKMITMDYYVNFVPYITILLSPLFIFIAVIFFTSKLAYNTEIVAMLANGINFYRLLVPYMVAAAILTGLILITNHYLLPAANDKRIAFENTYIDNPYVNTKRNIHMQIEKNTFVYLENYNTSDTIGYKFSLEKMKYGKLVYKMRADVIDWDGQQQKWIVRNYYSREILQNKEHISRGTELPLTINLKPADFTKRTELKETMTTPALNAFIEEEKAKGSDKIEFYLLEKYKRTSNAFATFILTLMGVAVASRKTRGGRGGHIAFGIGLSAAYIVCLQFTQTFSTNANLPPILGVWIPNFIFAVIAFVLLMRAPK